MKKAVLISIRPQRVQKIVDGEKTVEVRKTRPKLATPFTCYVYCTLQGCNEFFRVDLGRDVAKWNRGKWGDRKGHVIGKFTCKKLDWVTRIGYTGVQYPPKYVIGDERTYDVSEINDLLDASCLTTKGLEDYLAGGNGYGWHISDFQLYDTPCELSEFTGLRTFKSGFELRKLDRPPQSWCYVEEKQ